MSLNYSQPSVSCLSVLGEKSRNIVILPVLMQNTILGSCIFVQVIYYSFINYINYSILYNILCCLNEYHTV